MEKFTGKSKYLVKAVDQPLNKASMNVKRQKIVKSTVAIINSERINMKM